MRKTYKMLALLLILGLVLWGSGWGGYGYSNFYTVPNRAVFVPQTNFVNVAVSSPFRPVFTVPQTAFHASFTGFTPTFTNTQSRFHFTFIDP